MRVRSGIFHPVQENNRRVQRQQRSAVREIVWFGVRVPKTSYLVARVKITLNLASGPGYKEIDAVQLVGTEP